jgi:hypothetical protein
VDALDLQIRNHVYSTFVSEGRAQTTAETAAALGLAEDEVAAAYRRLHDGHALVLHPGTTEIRMLNPFSAVETPHRVDAVDARGSETAPGTRSGSRPPCTRTAR